MPCFEKMFIETRGKPIVYQGQTLVMSDVFPVQASRKLRLTFEACNGQWRQGVALKSDGNFTYDGKSFSGKDGLLFWNDTAPQSLDVGIGPGASAVRVYNVWDVGDGVVHARHNGAAMIIEALPNGRRYRCNDGFADDDFDDIIFRLEHVN